MRHSLLLTALFLLSPALLPAQTAGIVKQEWIYEKAPFPECHASTLVETPKGILVAFFGGTYEKHKDVEIWLARLQADGSWSAPRSVANGVQYVEPNGDQVRHPCWNPVFFRYPDGLLQLYFKVGPSPSTWWGEVIDSTDDGETWTAPRRLPELILGPVKNKPVLLTDGTLLCPTSSEHDGWRVHFERTKDRGRTWERIPPIHDGKTIGAIQPTIFTLKDGALLALGRSTNGKVFATRSKDLGVTWTEPELTALPNPNSGVDGVTLSDGRHLLVYNHTPKGRSPLNVAMSSDGINWSAAVVLETNKGEYSYPAVIQASDGLVHATYTHKRERIRHAVLDPTKFQLKPITNGEWPK